MDQRTGRIELITTDEDKADAQRRHLVPIQPEDLARVAGMNRHDRRAWAKEQRVQEQHPLGIADPVERRKVRNAMKRIRKLRRV